MDIQGITIDKKITGDKFSTDYVDVETFKRVSLSGFTSECFNVEIQFSMDNYEVSRLTKSYFIKSSNTWHSKCYVENTLYKYMRIKLYRDETAKQDETFVTIKCKGKYS